MASASRPYRPVATARGRPRASGGAARRDVAGEPRGRRASDSAGRGDRRAARSSDRRHQRHHPSRSAPAAHAAGAADRRCDRAVGRDHAGRDAQPARRSGPAGHQCRAPRCSSCWASRSSGSATLTAYVWLGFAGAAVATVLVYAVASLGREGATPIKLALAGAAITAAFGSITTRRADASMPTTLDAFRFWQVGSLAGRGNDILSGVAPFLVAGIALALITGRLLDAMALGDDIARGLGQRVMLSRAHRGADLDRAGGRRHRGGGADRVRGSDRAACGAGDHRSVLSLDPALFRADGADPAARRPISWAACWRRRANCRSGS